MALLTKKTCVQGAAVLGIVAAAYGCRKKDEYAGTSGTASPGTSTYASPGTGSYASPGMGAAPAQVAVEVIGVDTKAPSITVTPVTTGPTATPPAGGTPPEAGTNTGSRGTAGALADRRTIPVDTGAMDVLSRVSPGERVTITCSNTMAGTTTPDLTNCTMVTAISREPAGSARGL